MGYTLFAILVAVPLIEIALFIVVGSEIGVLATIAAIVLTTILGIIVVRRQGLATLERARRELNERRIPAGALGEGVAIAIAGVLLLLPGFFTDALGLALLVPPLRRLLVGVIGALVAPRFTIVVDGYNRSGTGRSRTVIEGEAVEVEPKRQRPSDLRSPWRLR